MKTRIDLLHEIARHGGRYFYAEDKLGPAFAELESAGLVDLHEDDDNDSYAMLTLDGEALRNGNHQTT